MKRNDYKKKNYIRPSAPSDCSSLRDQALAEDAASGGDDSSGGSLGGVNCDDGGSTVRFLPIRQVLARVSLIKNDFRIITGHGVSTRQMMNQKLKKKVIIPMLQEYLQVVKTRKNPKKKQKMKMQKKVKAMKIICFKKKTLGWFLKVGPSFRKL